MFDIFTKRGWQYFKLTKDIWFVVGAIFDLIACIFIAIGLCIVILGLLGGLCSFILLIKRLA